MSNVKELGNILVDPRTRMAIPLAMERMDMTGTITPAGAVLTITHSFKCGGQNTMEALYIFQLPRGGAVRRFKVKGKDFEVESKLSPREEARKEYEAGVQAGHLSTLAETSLDGVVTISVGQVQPDEIVTVAVEVVGGVELRDGFYRFRFPFTLAPNYHSSAPVSAAPGGIRMDAPKPFGDLILPEWKSDASGLHEIGFRLRLETNGPVGSVSSPSHNVTMQTNSDGSAEVWLASVSARPDKDLVLDVSAREVSKLVFADESLVAGAPVASAFPAGSPRWTALLPSDLIPKAQDVPRKILFLLDRSGSMNGPRMVQSQAALQACLSALTPADQFGLIRFSYKPEVFHSTMAPATDDNRARAARFLSTTRADGGTELMGALAAAVEVLGGPGDVFLITDGEVSETGPMIESMVASSCRVHVLGVGEAAQDRFLAQLARRTGGVQKMVNPSENVTVAGLELFNAVSTPRQKGVQAVVTLAGYVQVHEIGDVWDGRPVFITDNGTSFDFLPDSVCLKWAGGSQDVDVSTTRRSLKDGTVGLMWAGQQIEDMESTLDMAAGPAKKVIERELTRVSVDFGLASRVMSLSAVVKRVGDQAGVTPDQKVVAVGLPSDMVNQERSRGVTRGIQISAVSSSTATMDWMELAPVACAGPAGAYHVDSFNYSSNSIDVLTADEAAAKRGLTLGGVRGGGARGMTLGGGSGQTLGRRTKSGGGGYSPPGAYTGNLGDDDDGIEDIHERGREILTKGGLFKSAPAGSAKVDLTGNSMEALVEALSQIQGDGGVFGTDLENRVIKTVLLALALLQVTVDTKTNMYRAHLRRMADFLAQNGNVTTFPITVSTLVPLFQAASVKVPGSWLQKYMEAQINGAKIDVALIASEIQAALPTS